MLVKLEKYLEIKRGPGLPSKFYSNSGSLIRLTLGNFNYPNGGFKENDSKKDIYYTGIVKNEYILKKGDLITPLTEQTYGLLGTTAWIPEDNKYIQNGDIGLVLPFKGKLDNKFCYYLLSSTLIKKQLSAAAQQTKIRHTSPEKIKSCLAIIPPIDIQKRIGILLSSVDCQIERNNIIVKRLQVLAQAIYTRWFLQFEFPNEGGKPYKSSGGKMVWNDELNREIPEGWKVKNIKELCDVIWGQCPDGNNILPLYTKENNTIKYCSGAGDMRNGLLVDCQAKTNASKRYADKGDILMSVAGSIGALAIVDEKISLGRAAMAFTPKKCTKLFAYLAIQSLVDRIKQVASGSIQKVISDNHIDDMNLPYDEIIFKMFEKYNRVIEEQIVLSKESKMLTSLRNYLLPLLINGQLK